MAHYIVPFIVEPDYRAYCDIVGRHWPETHMPSSYQAWLTQQRAMIGVRQSDGDTVRLIRFDADAFRLYCDVHALPDAESALARFAIQRAADEDSGRVELSNPSGLKPS
jgi:hypothetical protein